MDTFFCYSRDNEIGIRENFFREELVSLQLVKMEDKYIPQLFEMMDEQTNTDEKIIPWSIRKCDYHEIESYIQLGSKRSTRKIRS